MTLPRHDDRSDPGWHGPLRGGALPGAAARGAGPAGRHGRPPATLAAAGRREVLPRAPRPARAPRVINATPATRNPPAALSRWLSCSCLAPRRRWARWRRSMAQCSTWWTAATGARAAGAGFHCARRGRGGGGAGTRRADGRCRGARRRPARRAGGAPGGGSRVCARARARLAGGVRRRSPCLQSRCLQTRAPRRLRSDRLIPKDKRGLFVWLGQTLAAVSAAGPRRVLGRPRPSARLSLAIREHASLLRRRSPAAPPRPGR